MTCFSAFLLLCLCIANPSCLALGLSPNLVSFSVIELFLLFLSFFLEMSLQFHSHSNKVDRFFSQSPSLDVSALEPRTYTLLSRILLSR